MSRALLSSSNEPNTPAKQEEVAEEVVKLEEVSVPNLMDIWDDDIFSTSNLDPTVCDIFGDDVQIHSLTTEEAEELGRLCDAATQSSWYL